MPKPNSTSGDIPDARDVRSISYSRDQLKKLALLIVRGETDVPDDLDESEQTALDGFISDQLRERLKHFIASLIAERIDSTSALSNRKLSESNDQE